MKKRLLALSLIFLLLFPQLGLCFYNPSTGRWLSRDPIEDEAFRFDIADGEQSEQAANLTCFVDKLSRVESKPATEGRIKTSQSEAGLFISFLSIEARGLAAR